MIESYTLHARNWKGRFDAFPLVAQAFMRPRTELPFLNPRGGVFGYIDSSKVVNLLPMLKFACHQLFYGEAHFCVNNGKIVWNTKCLPGACACGKCAAAKGGAK